MTLRQQLEQQAQQSKREVKALIYALDIEDKKKNYLYGMVIGYGLDKSLQGFFEGRVMG